MNECDERVVLKHPLRIVSKYCYNVTEHCDQRTFPGVFSKNGIRIDDTYLRRAELAPILFFSSLRLMKMSRHLLASSRPF